MVCTNFNTLSIKYQLYPKSFFIKKKMVCTNFNTLSIKYQLYPKSTKINAFGQEIR